MQTEVELEAEAEVIKVALRSVGAMRRGGRHDLVLPALKWEKLLTAELEKIAAKATEAKEGAAA